MKKMDFNNLCFRFFQDAYGMALDSEDAGTLLELHKTISEYNKNYLSSCRMVLRQMKKGGRKK